MDFVCPACGAPQPAEGSLCSGSFLDADHPANVPPVPARIEIAVATPVLDANRHPDHEWGPLEVVQARSIIKRLLSLNAERLPLQELEAGAFAHWLEATNPPPEVYIAAVREEQRRG